MSQVTIFQMFSKMSVFVGKIILYYQDIWAISTNFSYFCSTNYSALEPSPCNYPNYLNNQYFLLQQSQINDWEELFNRLTIFIMDCNGEQIRYAAQSFAELCHLFAEQLIKVVLTKKCEEICNQIYL